MKVPINCACNELYDYVCEYFNALQKDQNIQLKPSDITLFNTYKRQNGTTRIEDIIPNEGEYQVATALINKVTSNESGIGLFIVIGQNSEFKKFHADREKDREREKVEYKDQKKQIMVKEPTTFHALIFVKYYDPLCDTKDQPNKLKSYGYYYVHAKKASDVIIQHLVPDLLKVCLVKKTKDQQKVIDIYEEIRADNDMVNLVDQCQTLQAAEIGMGDILILQERTDPAAGYVLRVSAMFRSQDTLHCETLYVVLENFG